MALVLLDKYYSWGPIGKVRTMKWHSNEILTICVYCHRVKHDDKFWRKVDTYFLNHIDADISHGICPCCFEKYYPEFNDQDKTENVAI